MVMLLKSLCMLILTNSRSNLYFYLVTAQSCSDPRLFGFTSSTSDLGEKFAPDSKCFNTKNADPLCLRAKCNDALKSIDVYIGDMVLSCDEDFELLSIPNFNVEIECPRISQMCPNMFCPSNCAGRGVCDYNATAKCTDGKCRYAAICRCFNETDESPFCLQTNLLPNDIIEEDKADRLQMLAAVGGICVGLVAIFILWKWKENRDRR